MDFSNTKAVLDILLSTNLSYLELNDICEKLSEEIEVPHKNFMGNIYPAMLTQCILECYKRQNDFQSSVWYPRKRCSKEQIKHNTSPIKFSRLSSFDKFVEYELYNLDQLNQSMKQTKEEPCENSKDIILAAVKEFEGQYGKNGIAKILRGSKTLKDNTFNLQSLNSKYFGLLADRSKKEIDDEIDKLLEQNFLKTKKISFGRPVLILGDDYAELDKQEEIDFSPIFVGGDSDIISKISSLIENGENIFITGHAGCGKSYILNLLKQKYPNMAITSTTGIAAVNVKGQTIHSWMGIGIGNRPIGQMVEKILKRSSVKKQIQDCEMLALDEVSMLDVKTFEYIDLILRKVREKDAPFGGLQVIFLGDFFQLPPVKSEDEERKFSFNSPLWEEFNFKNVILTKTYRQNEENFIKALSDMRTNELDECDIALLKTREAKDIENESEILHIFATNQEADNYNEENFKKINMPENRLFSQDGIYKGSMLCETANNEHEKNILSRIDAVCPVERCINLKIGARVMLLVNLDFTLGLINGSCGIVQDIDSEYIEVEFDNGVTSKIERHDFEFYKNDIAIAARRQFPLRLAYGVTIHKSQGMSLDRLVVDCARIFEKGQAYVALSRIKTLSGLYLRNFSEDKVMVDENVAQFYKDLKSVI